MTCRQLHYSLPPALRRASRTWASGTISRIPLFDIIRIQHVPRHSVSDVNTYHKTPHTSHIYIITNLCEQAWHSHILKCDAGHITRYNSRSQTHGSMCAPQAHVSKPDIHSCRDPANACGRQGQRHRVHTESTR